MANFVPDDGRKSARFVLIGEAPGRNENRLLKPFVGLSGVKLSAWWKEVGLSRDDFYITNVYPFWPQPHIDAIPIADLNLWVDELHERLAQLEDPWIIVPTGNYALRALMRHDLRSKTKKGEPGGVNITDYRGSILEYRDLNGRIIKVIPTIHPAATLWGGKIKKSSDQDDANPGRIEKHCKIDWARIAHEGTFREVNLRPRQSMLITNDKEFKSAIESIDDSPISVDIETASGDIDVVGFSSDPEFAFVIPFRDPRWVTATDDHSMERHWVETLCHTPNPKVFQNGGYDTFRLWWQEGIEVKNYIYDLMYMHHALDPVDDHDLGYLCSTFIRHAYHKDEAKTPEKIRKYASQWEAYWMYNGVDNCVQIELFYELKARLEAVGRWEFYQQHYGRLIHALETMMYGGIGTDQETRRFRQAMLRAECIELQDRLSGIAGFPMYSKTDLARAKVMKLLYEKMKLPMQRKKGAGGRQGAITVDETALRKLQLKYPTATAEVVPLMLQHRRKAKLTTFFNDNNTDSDGRLRAQYLPMTEAGRLSSKSNPMGTGTNLQNIDREVRDTFVPDPGHVFLEIDESQAESRIVYVLSGDEYLIDLARRAPDVYDAHTANASIIFGLPEAQITKEQRYIGKTAVHGAQRGMTGAKLSIRLLNEDYIRTPEECQRYIDAYLASAPALQVYFQWIRGQILRHKRLVNSWGRVWDVRYERMGDDLFRRAYSDLPQSEVADHINQLGIIPIDEYIEKRYDPSEARLVAQVHDSVLISCVPERAWEFASILHESLTQTRTYYGARGAVDLGMFVEYKIGSNWKGQREWKRLPSKEEMTMAARELVYEPTVRTVG